jgi:hypothetical protein
MGSRATDLISSCPIDIQRECLELCLKYNRQDIKKLRLPIFVPKRLGGLGFPSLVELADPHNFCEDVPLLRYRRTKTKFHMYFDHQDFVKNLDHLGILGPSFIERSVCQALDSFRSSFHPKEIPGTQHATARESWYKYRSCPVRSMPIENFPSRKAYESCADSQDKVYGFVDVSSYYLWPSLVKRPVLSEQVHRLRHNQRCWKGLLSQLRSPWLVSDHIISNPETVAPVRLNFDSWEDNFRTGPYNKLALDLKRLTQSFITAPVSVSTREGNKLIF